MRHSSWDNLEQGWATGTRLWVSDKELGWAAGIVEKNERVGTQFVVTVTHASGGSVRFTNADNVSETEDMKLMNTGTNAGLDNLIDLGVLNEPEMLHCLQSRYKEDKIYTNTGAILIALNPFKPLPALYNKDVLEFYYNFGMARSNFLLQQVVVPEPPPHVYAIADKAYRSMMAGVTGDFSGKVSSAHDQSILISGESGAGKTESTKLIMQYVTIISSASREVTDKSSVMDRVLLSNPILESVGNAKTLRNNNSSRFGKFIELKFNRSGFLNSGYIQTYVLEKVRVVSQQPGERNYHIFYQMGAGGSEAQRSRWGISNVQSFLYANQGKVSSVEGIDDRSGFLELLDAFDAFEVAKKDQECILDVMAAILQLGQIAFAADGDDEGSQVSGDQAVGAALDKACALLGVRAADMRETLTCRRIQVAGSSVRKPLTVTQASDARDAIVKAVYSSFFDWLVAVINKQLVENDKEVKAQIGILDIFGFEFFRINSFEQLCINYANEALQQYFVKFVFEFEQKEYREEGIEWSFVEFKNNKSCLELMETKQRGIFSMIDDECFIPKGSDQNLVSRMYKEFAQEPCFEASGSHRSNNEFVVHHFAGSVTYSVASFMDKNRNEFPSNALDMLHNSSTPLIPLMFDDGSESRGSAKKSNQTVCTQFKQQLASLIATIQKTTSHYVRCIKPNDSAKPNSLHRPRVVEQLKCAGVIEVVRLSRAGYPYRLPHKEFFDRYRPILSTKVLRRMRAAVPRTLAAGGPDPGETCMRLVETLNVFFFQSSNQTYSLSYACQRGKTKMFIPKDEYNLLEGGRAKLTYESSALVQAMCRGHRIRAWYARAKKASVRIKRFLRNATFRRNVELRVRERRKRLAGAPRPAPAAASRPADGSNASVQYPVTATGAPLVMPGTGEWTAKIERNRPLSTVLKAPIGPRHFDVREDEEAAPAGGEVGKVPVTLLHVHHKKSTELEKMIYRDQFPTVWSTDRILKLFQRDGLGEGQGGGESGYSTPHRFPKEREYTAGQVKLLRVIGASEVVIDKAAVQGVTAEIEASGDALAKKALLTWKRTLSADSSDSAYDTHTSSRVYEARNLEGVRCYCKQFKPLSFPFGNREMAVLRELSRVWQQRRAADKDAARTFPFPILLGSLRTDTEILDPSFRRRWVRHFPHADPPEEGELWCIYNWDPSSFKTLRSFAEFAQVNTGFLSLGQQFAVDARWKLLKRVVRLALDALSFLHASGFCHGSLTSEAVLLQSFDVSADLALQRVKLSDLGLAQRVAELGAEGKAKLEEDLHNLGFIVVASVLSCFRSDSKLEVAAFRARITGARPDSLLALSQSLDVDQSSVSHRELHSVFDKTCARDMAKFKTTLATVSSWKTPLALLSENGAAGWKLVEALVCAPSKSATSIESFVNAFDKEDASAAKRTSFTSMLQSPLKGVRGK